jgi:protein-S-isoprenylcysteine O-methyltransferase Ste14
MGIKAAWIDFLYKCATGTKKVRTLLTPLGVIIFGLFTFCFILIALKTDALFDLPAISTSPWDLLIAVPVLILGIIITGWSVFHFLKQKGTPVPINPPPLLVDSGPYRYARNPMLSGIFLLMFGIGFWMGSFSLVLVFTPLFILINTLELKIIEEPELERRLGSEYINYKKNTPMFIPRLNH